MEDNMSLKERLEKLRNKIVVNMSKETRKNYPEEEERIIKSFMDKSNYEQPAFPNHTNKSKGQVEYVNVSEISNGKDKYIVKDVLYSQHFEGVASIWQYGARIDNKDLQIREISVQHNDKTFEFNLIKENGTYHEEGDSNSKGNIDTQTELKGCFNDPNLQLVGFNNYNIRHETYALTRLLYFVMTGKINIPKENKTKLSQFVLKGINPDETKRYQDLAELSEAFKSL